MSSSKATQETNQNPKMTLSSVVNAGDEHDSKAALAALALRLVTSDPNSNDLKNVIDVMAAVQRQSVEDDSAVFSSENPFLPLVNNGTAAMKEESAVVSSENPFLPLVNNGTAAMKEESAVVSSENPFLPLVNNGVAAVKDDSAAVSSKKPSSFLGDPLLLLAAAVENRASLPETNESSYPGEQHQKPSVYDSFPKLDYENIGNSTQTTNKSSVPIKKRKYCSYILPSVSKKEPQTAKMHEFHPDFMRIVEDVWMSNYAKLADYHKTNGHTNVLQSDPHKLLSRWVKRQRNNLKNNKLSPRQISLLDNLDFVSDPVVMRIVEHVWMSNYAKLADYHLTTGHSNVLRSDLDKQLSGWVKRQRNNLKDNKLSPRQISLLDNLDFVWDRIDGKWYKKFYQLVQFQKKFGHCYVTAKHDRSLAEWTQRQRRDFKNSEGKMTKDRVQKLEGLKGWSWDKLYNNKLLEMGIIQK